MSIIVQRESDKQYFNFSKGADSAIKPRLVKTEETEEMLVDELEAMAFQGLRTLMFGIADIYEEEVAKLKAIKAQKKRYEDEEVNLNIFEHGYTLLGITGVEDMLQDHVKETIHNFMEADIKVWMLTGDKGTTAH